MKNLQLTLALHLEPAYYDEDFIITNANIEAFRAINAPQLWPNGRLLIAGEEGSGKTHLANIFKSKFNAKTIDHICHFEDLTKNRAVILEDIESAPDEEFLFHLINQAQNAKSYLLFTTASLPSFQLADLNSRVNAMLKILVKPADDYLLRIILIKRLTDKQLFCKEEVIDYIMAHCERSYAAIKQVVQQIDELSLAEKKNITISLVKKILLKHITQESKKLI